MTAVSLVAQFSSLEIQSELASQAFRSKLTHFSDSRSSCFWSHTKFAQISVQERKRREIKNLFQRNYSKSTLLMMLWNLDWTFM